MTSISKLSGLNPSKIEVALEKRGILFAGVDEAGRGPLAGPVVAAAVIWDYKQLSLGINDSKLLDNKKRRELFRYILSVAKAVGISFVSPAEIDRRNILQASLLAMANAVRQLDIEPERALIDGNKTSPYLSIRQETCVKGDREHISIAAASIVAKTARDRIMEYYDTLYPGYGFGKHMGYPTKQHREALARLGPCPIHRTKFAGVRELLSPQVELFGRTQTRTANL